VFICRSYDQKTKWLFFWNTVYIARDDSSRRDTLMQRRNRSYRSMCGVYSCVYTPVILTNDWNEFLSG